MRIARSIDIPSGATLSNLYREHKIEYPKFFKMDTLCKLGFLASELLLEGDADRFEPREDRAVLMFSRNGCMTNDINYEKTMADYPSPSLFVYTLPNIITGEVAIRNKYKGETSAFLLEEYDEGRMWAIVEEAFQDSVTTSAIVGWIDCRSESEWTCKAYLIER